MYGALLQERQMNLTLGAEQSKIYSRTFILYSSMKFAYFILITLRSTTPLRCL